MFRKIGLLFTLLLAAPNAFTSTPIKDWTVLVYWAVDNDLYDFSKPYFKQFEEAGTTEHINVVVEYDYPGTRPTERILMSAHPQVVQEIQETNSGDPKTLSDFYEWGVKKYPAHHVMPVIASHGSNWSGVVLDHPTQKYMSMPELRSALQTMGKIKKPDLVLFDACRMSFFETLSALDGLTDYMVGANFDLNGFDHTHPLQYLAKNPKLSAQELGETYVRYYSRKPENASHAEMSASLLKPENMKAFTSDLENFFIFANHLPKAIKLKVLSTLYQSINEDQDVAFDLFEVIRGFRKLSPQLVRFGNKLLIQNGYFPEAPSFKTTLDDKNETIFLNHFPKNGKVQSVGFTTKTGSPSGLSITCAHHAEAYASVGSGLNTPAWNRLCSFWFPKK